MLRKKVFLYVSFVKSVQFVCAIIGGVYIASDDIDLFPAIALGRNINNSMPLFLLVLNKKRFDYYSATLSDFNIKIRNCNE